MIQMVTQKTISDIIYKALTSWDLNPISKTFANELAQVICKEIRKEETELD